MLNLSKALLMLICGGIILGPSDATAQQRFTDNRDGTITDHYMQLMWGKHDNQGRINWRQARKWVRYTFPLTIQTHYDDWRLPTPGELRTLFIKDEKTIGSKTDCGMKVKTVSAIKLTCGWVWSSETKDISASVFSFKEGYYFSDLMMQSRAHRALAVRSLKKN